MRQTLFFRVQCVFALMLLMLVDIGPIPVTAMIALFVVVFRPAWFKKWVDKIY
jgi:hypothetical protein